MSIDLKIHDPLPGFHVGEFCTGEDEYEAYRVGAEVKWGYSQYRAGEGFLLDSVYPGWLYQDGVDPEKVHPPYEHHLETPANPCKPAWLAIKDHKVHEVWLMTAVDREDLDIASSYHFERLGLTHPPLDAWPLELWARAAMGAMASERKSWARKAKRYGRPAEDTSFADYLRERMSEESFADQVLPTVDVAAEQDPTPVQMLLQLTVTAEYLGPAKERGALQSRLQGAVEEAVAAGHLTGTLESELVFTGLKPRITYRFS